jgi:sec-independent protein translocase protein TatC
MIKAMSVNPKKISFFDHVEELRSRLMKSVLAVVSAGCFAYFFVDEALEFIIKPVGRIVFTAPEDAFIARILLTFIGGFFLALPVILFQVWRFVAAGLKDHEIKYIRFFGPGSVILFFLGGIFAYFVIIPISLQFLLGFATASIVPMITIKSYVSFVVTMLLAFGMIFELPLILLFLTRIGIATPEFLIQKRKYAIVIILIVSAFLTPPDCVTQIIMAVPLIVLYEAGIIVSKITYRG